MNLMQACKKHGWKWLSHSWMLVLLLITLFTPVLWAQSMPWKAPGEDPVVLTQKVSYSMLPLNNAMRSSAMPTSSEMPGWVQAKVARFMAKAYSADTTGVITDENIVTRTMNDGLQKVCIQEVASTTQTGMTSGRYGPNNDPQMVVLRNDLVNICR
ncbi:MAG: hypothetical protein RLZZ397_1363 [Pseudomonadota bacterium]